MSETILSSLVRRAARAGLALAALAAGCGSERPQFTSGPYVQDVTSGRATIALVSAGPERLRAELVPADDPGAAPLVVEEEAAVRLHGLRFEGLSPDTAYRYRVVDVSRGTPRGEAVFRTAPLPGRRAVRFAVFGDTGATGSELGKSVPLVGGIVDDLKDDARPARQGVLARRVLERAPDLCLHAGDVVYPDGARERYAEAFFSPFAALIAGTPLFPAIGNHDVKSESGAPWDEVFHTPANNDEGSERYYSFGWGDVHFAVLDTETGRLGDPASPQVRWLADDLAAARERWKVVLLHRPVYSAGDHGETPDLQASVAPVCASLGVDVVFSGHDHTYQRFFPLDGVTYVVTGGGGKSTYGVLPDPRLAYGEALFEFVLGTADGDTLSLEAVDLAGNVFDAVTLVKGDPAPTGGAPSAKR